MSNEHIEYLKEQEKMQESEKSVERYMGGTVAIALGIAFLLALNFGFAFSQIWPIFFLIPVAFGGYKVVQDIRNGQPVNASSVLGLLTFVFIASVWIFGWSWGNVWPVFMIIGGIYAFSGTAKR